MVEVRWVGYPASFTRGRDRPVQYIVIHTTQGSEGPTSAEDGAAYDRRRTDGVSCHIFVDPNSAVREVPDGDRAHHARYHGNQIGLGIELCGLAQQTPEQWRDAASSGELAIAAAVVAQLCQAHGIPARRLTVAEVRAAYYAAPADRPKGICGHGDVSAAYPEDGGTHWDPGPSFPWAEFLSMVREAMEVDVNLTDRVPWNGTAQRARMTAAGWPAEGMTVAQLMTYTFERATGGAGYAAKLEEILAAAKDDGNTTVTLPPEGIALLAELRDAVLGVRAIVDEEALSAEELAAKLGAPDA